MGSATMTEKKGSRKPTAKADAPDTPGIEAEDEKEPQTSTRLFTKDQVRLGKLASLRGESIAETFRRVFGKQLDNAIIAAAEEEAAKIRAEQK